MARPGLSYEDVKKTAAVLVEQGMDPSIQRIRAVLGTGSNSTIADYLKRWRQELETAPRAALPPAIPEGVMAAVEAFWQVAVDYADRLYQTQRDQADQAVAAAEQARAESIQALEQARRELADTQRRLAQWQTQNKQLETDLLLEQERRTQAEASIAAIEQRALDAVHRADQTRDEAQSQFLALEQALHRALAEAKEQQAVVEQRLAQEKERNEVTETRLLRIIDQNRMDHAAERQTLNAALEAAQQRELQGQQYKEALQQEHTLVRSALTGAEERNRLLETQLAQAKAGLQEQERRYLESLSAVEALRSELAIQQRERQLLQEEIETYRQTLLAVSTAGAARPGRQ